ncbi:hypothetical protein B0H10DRAFT_2110723, partial [Mycena sp. CBHHK59/15]
APGSSTKALSGQNPRFWPQKPHVLASFGPQKPQVGQGSSRGSRVACVTRPEIILGKIPSKTPTLDTWPFLASKTPTSDKEITIFRPQKPQNPDKALVELPGACASVGGKKKWA